MSTFLDLLGAPAWPILLWCSLTASVASAFVLRGPAPDGRLRIPRWPIAIFPGIVLFGPLYGIAFEAVGRAGLAMGLLFGTAHAALSLALALYRRRGPGAKRLLRVLLGRLLFGTLLGFLYPVPPA